MKPFYALVVMAWPLAAQIPPAEQAFIESVTTAINNLTAGLPATSTPIVFGGNLVFADGLVVAGAPQSVLLAYVDGLKAAGAQRIELNPGVTSVNNPTIAANYLAVVRRARQLGMQVAINPEISPNELGKNPTFQDFENTAIETYVQLARMYQPDNFVIVHEPTTAQGALGIPGPQDWRGFITTMAPLIKAASPHTRVGAGGYQNGVLANLSAQENTYWTDFVTIPALDFMTMDIYNTDTFPTYQNWINLAKENHKGIYIEEAWAPHYLPDPLPASLFSPLGYLTESLDQVALVGAGSSDFAQMDTVWLEGLAQWASANGLEAMTAFTTQAFFAQGSGSSAYIFSPGYSRLVMNALAGGQLTSTGQAYQASAGQMGIPLAFSISSASYATLPSVFTPNCPPSCNPNSAVAPDELVSAFGVNLATGNAVTGSTTFPTNLAGTTMTLVDASNTPFSVPLYAVAPTQINYLVPGGAQPGPATLTIHSADGTVTTGIVLIQAVQPGLYTTNQQGTGAPSAIAVCAGTCSGWPNQLPNGQFWQYADQPISVASGDSVVLELYGTGIRHLAAMSDISVQIGGQNVPAAYAGAQGQFTGLDQINVTLPPGLAGSSVPVAVNLQDPVDNVVLTSNTVTLNLQ
jgi:uncharacterized protein (TIGR03437 family)